MVRPAPSNFWIIVRSCICEQFDEGLSLVTSLVKYLVGRPAGIFLALEVGPSGLGVLDGARVRVLVLELLVHRVPWPHHLYIRLGKEI